VAHPTWQKTKEGSDHAGWVFKNPGDPPLSNVLGHGSFPCDNALIPDTVNGCKSVREIYEKAGDLHGRYTVPVLWDKKTGTIVCNESSDIIEILNSEFNGLAKNPSLDLLPPELLEKMKEVDSWIYPTINDGVYRCGFAKSQQAYEEAFDQLFDSLDRLEKMLSESRYLCGNTLTLSDIRLFSTLVRFDQVYVCHFKCNKHFIHEHYSNLFNYLKDIYQLPGMASSVNMTHIKMHYFSSHTSLNTYGVIAKGNTVDFLAPHDRNRFSTAPMTFSNKVVTPEDNSTN